MKYFCSIPNAFYLAGLAVLAGCQSGSPHSPFRLQSMLSGRAESRPSDAELASAGASSGQSKADFHMPMDPRNFFAADKTPTASVDHPALGMHGNTTSAAAFAKRKANDVVDALTITPRVEHVLDPTNLEHDPGNLQPSLYLTAARLMEERGQLDEAYAQYARLLQVEPMSRPALIGVARLEHRRGNMPAAIAAYQKALQIVGQDPVILNDFGLCLARAGQKAQAIEVLRVATASKPDSLLYRNNLAAVLVEADQTEQAVATLAEALGPAVAHYNVGYLLSEGGKADAAQIHFAQALQIDPNCTPARTMMDRIAPMISARPERQIPGAFEAAAMTPTLLPPTVSGATGASNPIAPPEAARQSPIQVVAQQVTMPEAQPVVTARLDDDSAPLEPRPGRVQLVHHLEADAADEPMRDSSSPSPEIRLPRTRRDPAPVSGLIAPLPENLR